MSIVTVTTQAAADAIAGPKFYWYQSATSIVVYTGADIPVSPIEFDDGNIIVCPSPTGNVDEDTYNLQENFDRCLTKGACKVLLKHGNYLTRALTIYNGMTLEGIGVGSAGLGAYQDNTDYPDGYVGTVLKQVAGETDDYITVLPFHEPTFDRIGPITIKNLVLLGNSEVTSGKGLRFQRKTSPRTTAGQHSIIVYDVVVRNFHGDGIWLPCTSGFVTLTNVVSLFNGGYGYYFEMSVAAQLSLNITQCSEEGNLLGGLCFDTAGSTSSYSGKNYNQVYINLFFSEQRLNTAFNANGANLPIILNNCIGGLYVIENTFTHCSIDNVAPGDLVTIQNNDLGSFPTVSIENCQIKIYSPLGQHLLTAPSLINDVVNSIKVPISNHKVLYGNTRIDGIKCENTTIGYNPSEFLISVNAAANNKKWCRELLDDVFQESLISDAGTKEIFHYVTKTSGVLNQRFKRMLPTLGTQLQNSDCVLSSGWGDAATLTFEGSPYEQRFAFSIVPSVTGLASNPTITITYPDGAFNSSPVPVVMVWNNTDLLAAAAKAVRSTTALVITFLGLPVVSKDYKFYCVQL